MFVSGTTYQVLELGQPIENGFAEAAPVAPVAITSPQQPKRKLSVSVKPSSSNQSGDRTSPAGSAKTGGGGGGSKSGPSLLDLIEAGMLQPGAANMKVTYKGNTYAGALQGNGTILFRGSTFNTPSAFSVHVKRLVTPNKQGDDGWHSVYVDGVTLLNTVRQQYHAKAGGLLGGQQQPHDNNHKQQQQQSNKTPRRSQSSPRGQQQQQQQQQLQSSQTQQQQQQQAQQQQQQRPPLPFPKLKLGGIKGLPQQSNAAQQQQQQQRGPGQQQQQAGARVLQPAAPPEQQTTQPKPKLKFKVPLKQLGNKGNNKNSATTATAQGIRLSAAAGGGGGGSALPAAGQFGLTQQQQQQRAGLHCPLDPHPPILQGAPAPAAAAAGGGAAPVQQGQEVAAPHWVRCCRCDALRVVPADCWPQVEAVGATTWLCEDAGWDVKTLTPFTAACTSDVWTDAPDDGPMVPAAAPPLL